MPSPAFSQSLTQPRNAALQAGFQESGRPASSIFYHQGASFGAILRIQQPRNIDDVHMASDKVKLTYTLAVSEPGKISLSNPESANSLKLVATVRQESSPFPDRAVTLLTTYCALDTGAANAFDRKHLISPVDVNDDEVKICMYQFRFWLTLYPLRGVRDMHQRKTHKFITIPPPGQGSVEITWSLAPEDLLRFYEQDGDLKERLRRFTVGQRFKIEPGSSTAIWWTWGSLEHDLKDKKFSRWSLPNELPIVREAGQDEDNEINNRLVDIVDLSHLPSIIRRWKLPGTPDPGDEEPPNVKEMRMEGWVFGEPYRAFELTYINQTPATFEFVE